MAYQSTFILVADDCPIDTAEQPPLTEGKAKTKARLEYEMLVASPFSLTQEDLTYAVYVQQCLDKGQVAEGRDQYFSKGRPCLRASSLTKRYGWGAHYDAEGRIALVARDDPEYARLAEALPTYKGMKSKR